MSKNTTDELDEILDYAEIFYNDSKWEEREEITPTYTELKARLEALISNREKLARIEEVGFAYDLIQGLLLENDDTDFVCTEFQRQARSRMSELATLRKELDGEEPTHE